MNKVIENLRKYGAETDGAYRKNIGSDELYISGLDAFAFDDRIDRLRRAINSSSYETAERITVDLQKTVLLLELHPLENPLSLLSYSISDRNDEMIKYEFSLFEKSYTDFKRALLA